MDQQLYEALVEVARTPHTTTYSDVALLCGLDVRGDIAELGRRLDEISSYERENGRPLLSVVVIHRDGDQIPGDGFFRLARRLGVQRAGMENFIFFAEELRRCQEYWRGR